MPTLPPKLATNHVASLPHEVKELERAIGLDGRIGGASSKEEGNRARIARYNFLMPLRVLAVHGHPRYCNWLEEFASTVINRNDYAFWLSTIARASETEWEDFKQKKSAERKSKDESKKPVIKAHIKPLESNWKRAMSSKLVRRWV